MSVRRVAALVPVLLLLVPLVDLEGRVEPGSGVQERFGNGLSYVDLLLSPGTADSTACLSLPPYSVVRSAGFNISGIPEAGSVVSNLTLRIGNGETVWRFGPSLGRLTSFDNGNATVRLSLNATASRGLFNLTLPRNATSIEASFNLTGHLQPLSPGRAQHYQKATTPGIIADTVNAHCYDPLSDTLFAGTNAGLTILNLSSGERTDVTVASTGWARIPGNTVTDLFFEPSKRCLLVGTVSGAALLDLRSLTTRTFTSTTVPPIPNKAVEGVWYDAGGERAFLATPGGGLAVMDLIGNTTTVYGSRSNPALPDDGTCMLFSQSTNRLFYGTNANGVSVLDMTNSTPSVNVFSTATTPPLVDDAVRQVDFDAGSGMMFVATCKGMTAINLSSRAGFDLTGTTSPALPGTALESLDYDPLTKRLFIATGSSGGSGAGVAVVNLSSMRMETYSTASDPALVGNNARYMSYEPTLGRMHVSCTPTGGGTKGGVTEVRFADAPGNVTLDVGDDGSPEWRFPTPLASTVPIANLSGAISDRLRSGPSSRDAWGNEFVRVPVSVSAGVAGNLTAGDLMVRYSLRLPVSGLEAEINRYISTLPAGSDLTVPLNFTSDTAGRIRLTGLKVAYDVVPPPNRPPRIIGEPPGSALAGTPYSYQIAAEDPDNDTLVFALASGPSGLALDAASGLVTWTPAMEDVGRHYVSVNVSDGIDATWQNWTIEVSSVPGNHLPVIESYPVTAAVVGVAYEYDVEASDPDPGDTLGYRLDIAPLNMTVSSTTGIIGWVPLLQDVGQRYVRVNVTDGKDFVLQAFNITVIQTGMNNLPLITTSPPLNATVGVTYSYGVDATDVDGDALSFELRERPLGMSIDQDGRITWTPSTVQLGENRVVILVLDGKGYSVQSFAVLVRRPNHPPVITSTPTLTVPAGRDYSYEVHATDVDDGDVLAYGLNAAPAGMVIDNSTLRWRPSAADRGAHRVVVNVSDGRDPSLQEFFLNVTVPSPPPPPFTGPALLAGIGLSMIATVATVMAFVLARRRKRVAAPPPPDFSVEDVFLMYHDGRLIHHSTRRIKHEVDKEVLSSMMAAIQNFVEVGFSMEEAAPLGSMEYGGSKIVFERGRRTLLAVVISGAEPAELRPSLRQALSDVETEYFGALDDWDGEARVFQGIGRLLAPLSAFRAEAPRPGTEGEAPVSVKIPAEVEFYQGYVRLKVAVRNDSESVITDAAFKLIHSEDALRLDHIEPPLRMVGREVILGNIGRGEKKTVAYYLDPLICTESYLDGALTFKDHRGALRHLGMKRKRVSVVCPILGSAENINAAMLKRMLREELDRQDRVLFQVPDGMDGPGAFALAKAAVQRHDMRLVREYVREGGGPAGAKAPAFAAEAWYHAAVKGRPDRLVVRAGVSMADRTIELLAASTGILVVTGILAELKGDIDREFGQAAATRIRRLPSGGAPGAPAAGGALSGSMLERDGGG